VCEGRGWKYFDQQEKVDIILCQFAMALISDWHTKTIHHVVKLFVFDTNMSGQMSNNGKNIEF
jgi:hypothetical protein